MPAASVVALVLNTILTQHPEGIALITGDSPSGVEKAVRYLVPGNALTVVQRTLDDNNRPDFDTAHQAMVDSVDEVFVIHTDPLNSRLTKSVAQIFPAEKVHYPLDALNKAPDTLEDLLDEKTPEPVTDEEMPPDPFK
jgi:hypothetical protein